MNQRKIAVLSGAELTALTRRMVEEKDPRRARKLEDAVVESFYGESIHQLRAKNPRPWLVQERDLRRYLGRALDACERRHVVFFYHHKGKKRRLMALAPYQNLRRALEIARIAFSVGAYRRVNLAKLPIKKA